MGTADPKTFQSVISFLERQKLEYTVVEENFCTKLLVKSQGNSASISVFNTGKINVGGSDSKLKRLFEDMKKDLLEGSVVPGQVLPLEIERFPELLLERVPNCDPVICVFIAEAIKCYKYESYLGCAFMLGAASEKAIYLLIEAYGNSIVDSTKKEKFASRINKRMISQRYEEFASSYKGCHSKPTEGILSQELDTVIGMMFHFCRITRNEIGHPQIVPDLDKGVLLANLGHFITYIERIYGLKNHFEVNGVEM